MMEALRLTNAAELLLTTLPMMTTAILLFLSFKKIGYGYVGTKLTIGFVLLTASALISAFNQLTDMDPLVTILSQTIRLVGACYVAFAAIGLYNDVDENLP